MEICILTDQYAKHSNLNEFNSGLPWTFLSNTAKLAHIPQKSSYQSSRLFPSGHTDVDQQYICKIKIWKITTSPRLLHILRLKKDDEVNRILIKVFNTSPKAWWWPIVLMHKKRKTKKRKTKATTVQMSPRSMSWCAYFGSAKANGLHVTGLLQEGATAT